MARQEYYVLSHAGSWKIRHNDKDYPYTTQHAAIGAAAGALGHDAQVLVQGVGGQWRTEWTYGHDPYPPKG